MGGSEEIGLVEEGAAERMGRMGRFCFSKHLSSSPIESLAAYCFAHCA